MDKTYTHLLLRKWLPIYLGIKGKRFQDLKGLPRQIRAIARQQDNIDWANFTKGRITRHIRDMKTACTGNHKVTCMVDH